MGTIRNRMIIIHHYNLDEITQVRESAIAFFSEVMKDYKKKYIDEKYIVGTDMVSPILKSPVNGEYSFVIMGDCSKLGWKMSDEFDKYRRAWAKEQIHNVQHVLIASFGTGDASALIEEIE